MAKQLNIRNDEVYERAHRIAADMRKPVTEAMLTLLRSYKPRLPTVEELTPAQRAEYEALRALSREAAKRKRSGATSNHDDMYDEFGLPK
ncbi:MAG: type II toxin-antitoxin system VapB family antitoxin [Rhizobiales bacterium]|nr:type II toxin-antitoxin system VapB family antitoxin [Hyphomicrobiales bacterium]MBN9008727.1 type II toxin-antitoxin system VapB family antitoxin [Hyphomicrobiales bacterium]